MSCRKVVYTDILPRGWQIRQIYVKWIGYLAPPPKYYEAVDNLSEMGQIALKALEKIYLQKTLDLKRGARFEREFLLL